MSNNIYILIFFFKYLELRFDRTIRRFVTIIFIVSQLFFLPVVMYIPSISFVEGKSLFGIILNFSLSILLSLSVYSIVTKHNIHVVNTIVSCVVIVYTMLGGIQAVVWTDVGCLLA